MQEYTKKQIMRSRHQFIYGANNDERIRTFKQLAEEFQVTMEDNVPMAVFLEEYGLPNIESIDMSMQTSVICREFLTSSILFSILREIQEKANIEAKNKHVQDLIKLFNYIKSPSTLSINSLDDLVNMLANAKDSWLRIYANLAKGRMLALEDVPYIHIEIEHIIIKLKQALQNESYFALLINHDTDISLISQQAVNTLINARINKDLSIKIAASPEKWGTYRDLNGQFIEYVHDYDIVELDDSYKSYIRKLKKKD